MATSQIHFSKRDSMDRNMAWMVISEAEVVYNTKHGVQTIQYHIRYILNLLENDTIITTHIKTQKNSYLINNQSDINWENRICLYGTKRCLAL